MFKIGCIATRAALRHLKGEPLPEKILLPGRDHRQVQLQGQAHPGGPAQLSGMERGREVNGSLLGMLCHLTFVPANGKGPYAVSLVVREAVQCLSRHYLGQ
jgi:hypothetical protein